MSRLKELYDKKVQAEMLKKFGYKNVNMVPKLKKITVNCCSRDVVVNGKVLDSIIEDISLITGQKAIVSRAKKSVASFKIREDQALGAHVTLRGKRMYEFLDRLISLSLPRVRDFRGISPKSFDGRGNYTLGLKEQIMFPEISYDKIDKVRGLNINIETSAKTNEEGRELLSLLGMPFKK